MSNNDPTTNSRRRAFPQFSPPKAESHRTSEPWSSPLDCLNPRRNGHHVLAICGVRTSGYTPLACKRRQIGEQSGERDTRHTRISLLHRSSWPDKPLFIKIAGTGPRWGVRRASKRRQLAICHLVIGYITIAVQIKVRRSASCASRCAIGRFTYLSKFGACGGQRRRWREWE